MITIKITKIGLAAVILLFAPLAANSSSITDRTTLQTLIGGPGILEDFESYSLSPGSAQILATTLLDSTTIINTQGPGLVGPDVRYTALFDLQWNGSGYYGSPSQEITAVSSAAPTINIFFDVFTDAFGVDLRAYSGFAATASMSVYRQNGNSWTLIGTNDIALPGSGVPVFAGWSDAGGIGRIELTQAGRQWSPSIDNLEYGVTVVPVPAAVWLFGSGLLGLVGIVRRKKPAQQVK